MNRTHRSGAARRRESRQLDPDHTRQTLALAPAPVWVRAFLHPDLAAERDRACEVTESNEEWHLNVPGEEAS